MEINFAKSTVNLDNAYFIVTKNYNTTESLLYSIIPKSYKLYSKDIDFISNLSGWVYDGTEEEFQEFVNEMNDGLGYEYIQYWDGHNINYIDLDSDFLTTMHIDLNNLELIDICNDNNSLSNEYALLKDVKDNSYYVVYGTSCRQEDVFAEIQHIGKDAGWYYSMISTEE